MLVSHYYYDLSIASMYITLSAACYTAGWDPLSREIYDLLSPTAKPRLAHAAIWDGLGLSEIPGWRAKNPNG